MCIRDRARGLQQALLVVDMPFLSYQTSCYDALYNAGRLVKEGGANAVKLEGGQAVCPQIAAISQAGVPVMAHLGLTPQAVNALGGYKVQGKTQASAQQLLDDALAVQQAGAFALLLECVPAPLAQRITEKLTIPTIGIGAGAGCDGQILVYQDLLAMSQGHTPKFVKQYADLGQAMTAAFQAYDQEVKAGAFPDRCV